MKKEDKDYIIKAMEEMLGGHWHLYSRCHPDNNPDEDICRKRLKRALTMMRDEISGDGVVFIDHIKAHLKEGECVVCKICNKSVNQILAEEALRQFKEKIVVGAKIKFREEKQRYTVQACNERFVVCTKPFNPKKTVLYSIIDFKRNVRGMENLIFCFGFETKKLCEEALDRLTKGETEVSHRNWAELKIEAVDCGSLRREVKDVQCK